MCPFSPPISLGRKKEKKTTIRLAYSENVQADPLEIGAGIGIGIEWLGWRARLCRSE